MTAIVKVQPAQPIIKVDPNTGTGAFLLAMFLMFARAPRKAEPDVDGFYDLAEIGEVRELKINRMTPYSLAEKE